MYITSVEWGLHSEYELTSHSFDQSLHSQHPTDAGVFIPAIKSHVRFLTGVRNEDGTASQGPK